MRIHNLGFPRIGARRELKTALEAYWRGDIDRETLEATGRDLRARHWALQRAAGLDLIPVGDFSFYDSMLDHAALLGVVPPRFGWQGGTVDLDLQFAMARGTTIDGAPVAACEMTKWFDTNYHYLVPELAPGQRFRISSERLFDEVREARALGLPFKPVLIGPVTWLWLAKSGTAGFDRLSLLEPLVEAYGEVLERLAAEGADWVQVDEPALVLDLPPAWQQGCERAYHALQSCRVRLLLTTYFGALDDNLGLAARLPVAGLHVDLVRGAGQLDAVLDRLPPYKVLSLGVIDGRNVWRTDPDAALRPLTQARERVGDDRLWIAPSCSLLHVPVDLGQEDRLDADLRSWLAFAVQKLDELALLRRALTGDADALPELESARQAVAARHADPRLRRAAVAERLANIDATQARRQSPFRERRPLQQARLRLPPFPTTTIGSFPQTAEIRQWRRDHRQGRLDTAAYEALLRGEIAEVIRRQEALGLDVLVHGEPERTDMVEYFGERLEGFAITRFGWVQSYGSRCVKPPILYGDVQRKGPITVEWARFAQSLTERPVKGMLTGPVTILNWSFVRDDRPRADTCRQIALALRDEVCDLEAAGIRIIQIDEAALREGLPLRQRDQAAYLEWAVAAFRLTASGVRDETQIHTHMCYSEFNDILAAIADMDADVITIETSRSRMELLDAFVDFEYPNDIGPGVYDIHSPNVPTVETMVALLERAAERVPAERLWVNPDCGLKTRGWAEVEPALRNMVAAARRMRAAIAARNTA